MKTIGKKVAEICKEATSFPFYVIICAFMCAILLALFAALLALGTSVLVFLFSILAILAIAATAGLILLLLTGFFDKVCEILTGKGFFDALSEFIRGFKKKIAEDESAGPRIHKAA
jgi:flagellar biosynthesis protein FliQ